VTALRGLLVAGLLLAPGTVRAADPVRVHAAGSLRAVVRALGEAFTAATGVPVQTEFGASGLLRERLEKGEAGDVFMSANLEHPARLSVTTATLLDRMLDPAVRLGTSTPRADPAGDYAWEVFRKSEALRPGSRARPNAAQVVRELPGVESIALPPELRVGADYGLTVLAAARVEPALRWVLFVLSPDGQAILDRFGFAAPTRPAPG
jgi:ABC-type molybdate transport system substrate-binding protein